MLKGRYSNPFQDTSKHYPGFWSSRKSGFHLAIDFAGALLIAVVGWWLAGAIEHGTRRALMSSSHMDLTVGYFLASLARYSTLVNRVCRHSASHRSTGDQSRRGNRRGSLAIGLALQGTLSHMAAGVMLLIFRPFRIGDSIEVAGKSGTVKNLNLLMTELASGDNIQVLIPNGQVCGAAMSNFSAYGTRRISLSVPVMLDKEMETISSRLRSYIKEDKRVLDFPSPSVRASNLIKESSSWSRPGRGPKTLMRCRNDCVRTLAALQTGQAH